MSSSESRPAATAVPALFLLASLAGSPQLARSQCVELPGCELVWSDEFDGDEVDPSRWTYQLGDGSEVGLPGGWGNAELQYYQTDNATVSGGFLTITAREQAVEGHEYTSARLRTLGLGDWLFGRVELRAKMPIGQGLWPAFWMLPSDPSLYGTWAASGEIDIMEYLGDAPAEVFGTLHYGGPFPSNVFSSNGFELAEGTFHDDFHEFAIEWELGEIRWYVDGEHYATQTSWFSSGGLYPAPFDVEFYLLVNLAVGGNLPGAPDPTTEFPQELVLDYVRVYQVFNAPPVVSLTSPTAGDLILPGDDLTITADVTDDGSIEFVQFLQDNAVLDEDTVPPYETTVSDVAAGCYTLRAQARDDGAIVTSSAPVDVAVGAGCPRAPYRMTPSTIPGTLEVEDYDIGGPGVAYDDVDASNNGGAYRPTEGVDLERSTDVGLGFNVGWAAPGEWLEYAVNAAAGTYDVELRVASAADGGTLHLELDGVDATGPVVVPGSFGWQNWTTVVAEGVTVGAGLQTLRLSIDSGAFNVNRITFPAPPPGPLGAVPNGGDVPGEPLAVSLDADGDVVLDWGASCLSTSSDYVVYEGTLGEFTSHSPVTCTTGGATTWSLAPETGARYFLISPTDGVSEGSRGTGHDGAERAPGAAVCLPMNVGACPAP